jgi:hypothetical protein
MKMTLKRTPERALHWKLWNCSPNFDIINRMTETTKKEDIERRLANAELKFERRFRHLQEAYESRLTALEAELKSTHAKIDLIDEDFMAAMIENFHFLDGANRKADGPHAPRARVRFISARPHAMQDPCWPWRMALWPYCPRFTLILRLGRLRRCRRPRRRRGCSGPYHVLVADFRGGAFDFLSGSALLARIDLCLDARVSFRQGRIFAGVRRRFHGSASLVGNVRKAGEITADQNECAAFDKTADPSREEPCGNKQAADEKKNEPAHLGKDGKKIEQLFKHDGFPPVPTETSTQTKAAMAGSPR